MANEFMERTRDLEVAFSNAGVMNEIAKVAIELSPAETAEIILPEPTEGEPLDPRFQLVDNAKDSIKSAAGERESELLSLATRLDMRREESLSDIDIARIHPDDAIWVVEGGANRTSVVRRQLAIEAMQRIYGDEIVEHTLYQFGSDRKVEPEKNGKPNPEYRVVQEIAGNFLPHKEFWTEFDVNLASALQNGFEIEADDVGGSIANLVVRLRKEGAPELVLLEPYKTDSGGLEDGFSAVWYAAP
jgi:hypothetical protein